MAKARSVAFLASALVVLAIAGSAHCRKVGVEKDVRKEFVFNTAGYAICDPCRFPNPSKFKKPLPGSLVGLYCDNPKTWARVSKVVTTRKDGSFEISLSGVHDGDNCMVSLEHTPNEECNYHSPLDISFHHFVNVHHNETSPAWSGELVLWPERTSLKKCNVVQKNH